MVNLNALSPLDGRYANTTVKIANYFSESALVRTRIEIESKYLIDLSEEGVIRSLSSQEKKILKYIYQYGDTEIINRVKEIEKTTKHDVKAVEYALREYLIDTSMADMVEMIHFGLTSEDVNNLAYRLMISRSRESVVKPVLKNLIQTIAAKAKAYKDLPMVGRTHGQIAVPTTLGKEFVNFGTRLHKQVKKMLEVQFTGKLNGAVGNYNAHLLASPKTNWIAFSKRFVKSLGFTPSLFTAQTNTYEDMIEYFQCLQRINGIVLDFNQDMWRYISDGYFVQRVKKGEVGSSTMPQKVNPINFENSEGNLQLANGIWDVMVRELPISRLQRDLSDSTLVRNIGVGVGHGVLAYQNTLKGLETISPNQRVIESDLEKNWNILAEGLQTVLRIEGVENPYDLVAKFVKGKNLDRKSWLTFVDGLDVRLKTTKHLRKMTPKNYTGVASKLVDLAITEIGK